MPGMNTEQRAPDDGYAIASFVLSLLWLGGLGSLLAVIFGHMSRVRAQRAGQQPSGLASAGFIIGWVGIALLAVLVLVAAIVLSHHPDPMQQWNACVNSAIANGTPAENCGPAPG